MGLPHFHPPGFDFAPSQKSEVKVSAAKTRKEQVSRAFGKGEEMKFLPETGISGDFETSKAPKENFHLTALQLYQKACFGGRGCPSGCFGRAGELSPFIRWQRNSEEKLAVFSRERLAVVAVRSHCLHEHLAAA